MTREQQDKLWNDLSEEDKAHYREQYAEQKAMSSGVPELLKELFGSHNLNPKPLTYEDVAKKLFGENNEKQYGTFCCPVFSDSHCDKLSAINALINVAKYLNGDWKPDFDNYEQKWVYSINKKGRLHIIFVRDYNSHVVYFRTEELALQAVQILGEETIRLALSTDY